MNCFSRFKVYSVGASIMLAASPASATVYLTPGDLDGNGVVNFADLLLLSQHLGETLYRPGDLTFDNEVSMADLLVLAQNYGNTGMTREEAILRNGPPSASAYASWHLSLIGLTSEVAAAGNYGLGTTIGIVDTGIDMQSSSANWDNRISPYSTCLSVNCDNGHDFVGHGSTVARLAAGGGDSGIGVAPMATVLGVGVLYNGGMFDYYLPAAGIRYAVDHGANVINVSLANALNYGAAYAYAAEHNVVSVVAAGNTGQSITGALTYGWNANTVGSVLIVGSTDSNGVINASSTRPGWDVFMLNDGSMVRYYDRFIYAPGGATSFTAPLVTGAVALVQSRWRYLTSQAVASIILDTATDMGDPGHDPIYGVGMLNVAAALSPVGALRAVNASGKDVEVGSLSLGSAVGLRANTVTQALDQYGRNFPIAINSDSKRAASASLLARTILSPKPATSRFNRFHLADGSQLAMGEIQSEHDSSLRPDSMKSATHWFMAFTDTVGGTVSAGHGFPAAASFTQALWGTNSTTADMSQTLGISNSLTNLADGGMFAAYGHSLNSSTRVAFSYSQTGASEVEGLAPSSNEVSHAFNSGMAMDLSERVSMGLNVGMLHENGRLLGSVYTSRSALSLGEVNDSVSVGLTAAVKLAPHTNVLMEASLARTEGNDNKAGIISDISPLHARSVGAALVQRDTFDEGDSLSLSAKAPMRVFSGSATLTTQSVDGDTGEVSLAQQGISLRPDGHELSFGVNYQTPIADDLVWSVAMEHRRDADNVSGFNDTTGFVSATYKF